ncbi:MAG: ABC transporter ATP-binding protein/permease [Chloroflexi bacterium]|nr:ABC transporter ATP-binding protein/permease [Chloroflexota bacterium]
MDIPLRQYWNLLVGYLRPQRNRAVLLGLLLLCSISLQLINPQILRYFIDTATTKGATGSLALAAVLFILIALGQQVVAVSATYVSENVAWTATNKLRSDLAQHCLSLDMSFHNAHTPGELIERIDGDVAALANFFSQFVIQVLGNTVLLAGILVLLFREDWRIGLALTTFAGLALLALLRLSNIATPHWEASRQASAEMFGFLEERLAGTEDIRSSGAKPYVMGSFFRLMRARWRKELKAGLMVNIMVNTTWILFTVGNAVAFVVGAMLYQSGQISIGTVFLVFQYSNILFMPLERITQQVGDLQKAGASITRIQGLRQVKSNIHEPVVSGAFTVGSTDHDTHKGDLRANLRIQVRANGHGEAVVENPSMHPDGHVVQSAQLPPGPLAVEFQDISFGYEAAEPVLQAVSFKLQPGTVLGLLGRTGSGKTTLARLLFRLYDPDQGAVRLGDAEAMADIRALRLDDLRQHIGMVTQDVQLFNASVRDNLTFFDKSISDERVLRTIEDLGMWSWYCSLAHGLDTELASGGGGLSAGEAQLLAFTRIFLKEPGLVILDEASSRLDPATEQLIEHAVDRLLHAPRRTAIIIAHRLATVHRADQIMILDKGRVTEYGAREDLARDTSSRFYGLLQTGLEEVLA